MTSKRTYTFANCQIVDPVNASTMTGNVVVEGEVIRSVGEDSAGLRIECEGLICTSGLVDLSSHLRQPGREDSEIIATGTAAAAAGGYTAASARQAAISKTKPQMTVRRSPRRRSITRISTICTSAEAMP